MRNIAVVFQCNLNVIEKELVIAPKFVERFTTITVKEGEPVSFSARAVGTPVPRITWQKVSVAIKKIGLIFFDHNCDTYFDRQDGVQINDSSRTTIQSDSGASTLDIYEARTSDAGWYQCTAQNVAGSTATRARLFVKRTSPEDLSDDGRRLHFPKPTKVIEPE